jgi:hypothetical protein
MTARPRIDLLGTAAVAVIAALVAGLAPGVVPLRTLCAGVLLLLAPGYALQALLFRGGMRDFFRVLLAAVALSLALAILLALLLDLTVGLTRGSWAVSLGLVTCVLAAAAARVNGESPWRGSALPPVRPRHVLALAVVAMLLVATIVLGRTPLQAPNAQGYTALWLLPARGSQRIVRVGVTSGQLQAVRYRLVVESGSQILFRRSRIELQPGQRVKFRVLLPRRSSVVRASLFSTATARPYRTVVLG